jgi:hypothetical protein
MKSLSVQSALACLALALLAGCGGHAAPGTAADDSLTALKNLRDRGVLTQPEYEAKAAALQGGASPGAGDGTGLGGPESPAPVATRALGAPEAMSGGLAAGGGELSATSPAATPRTAPRAARNRLAASNDPPAGPAGAAEPAAVTRSSAMRSLWDKARARETAVAHSAHDLALRMFGKSRPSAPTGQGAPNPQDAAALQSYGQTLLHGDAAVPADDNQGLGQPPAKR